MIPNTIYKSKKQKLEDKILRKKKQHIMFAEIIQNSEDEKKDVSYKENQIEKMFTLVK